jgi:hypothetical protein
MQKIFLKFLEDKKLNQLFFLYSVSVWDFSRDKTLHKSKARPFDNYTQTKYVAEKT